MAASDIVSGIGGAASGIAGMFPGIGTGIGAGIGALSSIVSGVLKNKEAKDQAGRAEDLRRRSENLQKPSLRPEYLKTLRMNEMAALYGLPNLNAYEENIDKDIANNAIAIRESSPNGAAALSAISAVLGNASASKNKLYIEDAAARERKLANVANTVWNTGDKQMDLVAMQRADKRDLNSAAMNLENAATANKIGSLDQILATVGALGNTVGSLAGEADINQTNGAIKNAPVTGKTKTTPNGNIGGGLMNSDIFNLQNTPIQLPKIPANLSGIDQNTLSSVIAFLKANPQFNTQWAKGT